MAWQQLLHLLVDWFSLCAFCSQTIGVEESMDAISVSIGSSLHCGALFKESLPVDWPNWGIWIHQCQSQLQFRVSKPDRSRKVHFKSGRNLLRHGWTNGIHISCLLRTDFALFKILHHLLNCLGNRSLLRSTAIPCRFAIRSNIQRVRERSYRYFAQNSQI